MCKFVKPRKLDDSDESKYLLQKMCPWIEVLKSKVSFIKDAYNRELAAVAVFVERPARTTAQFCFTAEDKLSKCT